MAVVMVAMLAFGGTYAYFTASANKLTDDVLTGKVTLTTASTLVLQANVVPTQTLFNDTITYSAGDSTVDTWVFVKFDAKFEGVTSNLDEVLTIAAVNSNTWEDLGGGVYGSKATVGVSGTIDFPVNIALANIVEHNAQGSTTALQYMGKKVEVTIEAASVQAYGFVNAAAALSSVKWTSNTPAAQG